MQGAEAARGWETAIRQALMPVILQDAPSSPGHTPHSKSLPRVPERMDLGGLGQGPGEGRVRGGQGMAQWRMWLLDSADLGPNLLWPWTWCVALGT